MCRRVRRPHRLEPGSFTDYLSKGFECIGEVPDSYLVATIVQTQIARESHQGLLPFSI